MPNPVVTGKLNRVSFLDICPSNSTTTESFEIIG